MKQPKVEPTTSAGFAGLYRRVEDWASWLAVWMVYWANNKPENKVRSRRSEGIRYQCGFMTGALAGVLDQNPPHGLGGGTEEVATVFPGRVVRSDQS